ncbi:MAG: iron-sulfur cluster carrier protein ApbC [Wenzhouxiangellaceae bacterium]|nr:iron-sulfur cluster carrier protein ApbC [Wenzhouxiangellaceae bacterium]
MSSQPIERVEQALARFEPPVLGTALREALGSPRVEVDGDAITVHLKPGFACKRYARQLRRELGAWLCREAGVENVQLRIEPEIAPHQTQPNVERLKSVKNIIAVSSAKGGVGKSTVSANLALALAGEGARVGMLDADIYGPSQPRMLGVKGRPDSLDGQSIEPLTSYGIQSISVGYLIDDDEPMIWRGPMVTRAMQQLLGDTRWADLDYLVIDMPPGTGDIQLTLAQQVPVAGAVIVTTPQDIATLDARKGLQMFRKVNVPVLGVVENMSLHTCSQCGHTEHLFGEGGGARIAEDYGVPLLGSLPLDISIREHVDNGRPSVVADPDGEIAGLFHDIAVRMTAKLSLQATDYTHRMPKIVIR